ncbi:cell division protein FtsQ/DivIB [Spirochaeta cellobiosiphila]|uniref:cell division protein FtsQ/DivIB n=1 Tax=Spirochaeta cellobiosiphila TaxID=504483 RepID=UPI00146DFF52|nr:FtsQ-type POTRA domain-containing protein [Spirochaeta cellobiosiphila]
MKIIIFILVLFLIFELFFYLVISPRLRVTSIVVESEISLNEKQIKTIAGLNQPIYFYSLQVDQIESRLETVPVVRKAVVSKQFPGKLKIVLYKRQPLFISLIGNKGNTIPVMFDTEGIAYEWDRDIKDFNYPIISGLQFENIEPGMDLPSILDPLVKNLVAIKEDNPNLFYFISELRIQKKGDNDFDLLLYPNRWPLPVRIGSDFNIETLKQVLIVLDVMNQQKHLPQEIDMRTDHVVYSQKER